MKEMQYKEEMAERYDSGLCVSHSKFWVWRKRNYVMEIMTNIDCDMHNAGAPLMQNGKNVCVVKPVELCAVCVTCQPESKI